MLLDPRINCLGTAFCKIVGISSDDFCKLVGHDGYDPITEVEWTDDDIVVGNKTVGQAKGFHIQEIIDVALALRLTMTPIELDVYGRFNPEIQEAYRIYTPAHDNRRFYEHLRSCRGIIEGHRIHEKKKSGHAVANCYGSIHDIWQPVPYIQTIVGWQNFFPGTLWRIEKR